MKNIEIEPIKSFDLVIDDIASDKSISHRAALFSLLSDKKSIIRNFLLAKDTLSMLKIVKLLGAKVVRKKDFITIVPPKILHEPKDILDCGNAGTAIRLLIGFLATKKGHFVLHGDKYLASRPMKRIVEPLKAIGAQIDGRDGGDFSPLSIRGKELKEFKYESKIPSAQVKTAMILAALNLKKESTYIEHELSRNHTEKMLNAMGADIKTKNNHITISPQKKPFKPLDITIPADPSSGFFFAIAVAIVPNSKIRLKNMLLNKTRVRAYKILEKMGLKIEYKMGKNPYDKVGDITIKHAPLKGIVVSENISHLIDEIPALSIAFSIAKGKSEIKNAKELRVKESDRINAIVTNLKKANIKVEEKPDGFIVYGGDLKRAEVSSFGDHRIAMSFIIAGLKCGMKVKDIECISTSFPNFFEIVEKLKKGYSCI